MKKNYSSTRSVHFVYRKIWKQNQKNLILLFILKIYEDDFYNGLKKFFVCSYHNDKTKIILFLKEAEHNINKT